MDLSPYGSRYKGWELMSDINAMDHIVVVNDEEQYSTWLADQEIPAGWQQVGQPASKDECLSVIDGLWTDMRPRSLRAVLDAARQELDAANGETGRLQE
jgi:MbtH protein